MIRWFCKWYLSRFPDKLKNGWYPAQNPWQVAVTISGETGNFIEYFDYDKDNLFWWMGEQDWTRAKTLALDRASYIKKNGVTIKEGPHADHYPAHRVYLVQTYPKPKKQKVREEVDHHNV